MASAQMVLLTIGTRQVALVVYRRNEYEKIVCVSWSSWLR
jgi:hypothetical protein